jgi:cytochrome P450
VTVGDLYDPAVQLDWYPTYRQLRDSAPVYRMPGTNTYVISRYADVLHVLRHQDVFPTGASQYRTQAAKEVYERTGWPKMTPLSVNPPDHRQYRALVDGFFDTVGAQRWKTLIETTIDELLHGFEADGAAEIVQAFALPLPVRVITSVLGFPAADIADLKRWSEAWVLPFAGGLSEATEVWVAEQVVEFQHYIAAQIAEKRRRPTDDVLTELTRASFGGERPLTDHEIITMIDHLFIGGNETTTFAITSALWIMLREPGLYDVLRQRRELVEVFVEESMRLESPTQGLFRLVAQDTEIGGAPIPAGSIVHIRYASANRDERMFEHPDDVDLERPNVRRHMAFSLGEHHCPGHGLSRLEQNLALHAILDRLPELRLAPGNDFAHQPGFVLRALERLHVEWTPEGS